MLLSGSASLKDKVSNLSDFPVLMAATHSDPNPTPAHLSQRVVSISFVSRQKCVHLMEHLLDIAQANSKSLHSRIKAVRLLQELVMKGDPEFQALLQKEEHKLKAVSCYLDPQAPSESARLREATAALLEVLFEETSRSLPPPAPFSAPAGPHGLVSPSYHRSQYQGFGNPHFVQQRASSSSGILSLVSDKVSDLLSHVPPTDPNRFASRGYPDRSDSFPSGASGYAQNSSFYSGARCSYPINSRDRQLPQTFPHTPGTPGLEWDSSRPAGSPPLPCPAHRPEPVFNGSGERGEEGQLERQLVFSFTAEGGVRNRPSRQELEEFIARSRSLDLSLLVELLASQIGGNGTGSKLKTLFALEALYRSFPAQVGVIITAHSQTISCLSAKGDTPAVRTKAREIMSILGISSAPPADSSAGNTLIPTDCSASNTLVPTDCSAGNTLIPTDCSASHTLIPTDCSASHTLIPTDSSAGNTLMPTDCSAGNTLMPTDCSAGNTLVPTDCSAGNTLIPTDSSAGNTLVPTDCSAGNTLIPTDTITQEVSGIASNSLLSTEPTDSLFEGMLTSQPEDSKLIAGLEEFAIPETGPSNSGLSDMINLGTTNAPCVFDPLLDIGHTRVTTSQTLNAFNSTNLFNHTTASSQSYPTMNPIQSHQPSKSTKTDSFGFISEHIHDLKGTK